MGDMGRGEGVYVVAAPAPEFVLGKWRARYFRGDGRRKIEFAPFELK